MSWWRRLLKRQEMERHLDAELRFHFDGLVTDNLRSGMSEPEARRHARVQFGGMEQVKEECRDARGMIFIDDILRDLRYAGRALRQSPGFAALAVLIMAVGIGVNAAVFTVTNAELFKGFAFLDNDRILYMHTVDASSHRDIGISYPDFEDWRAQAKSFEGMSVVKDLGVTLADRQGSPEGCIATQVSANAFQLIRQRPILGRDFAPSDDAPGAPPVAILSYGFWERRYGKDPAVIGRTARMNGVLTTIIGVMPQGLYFPLNSQDLWMPLGATLSPLDRQKRDVRIVPFVFGRMAEGVTAEKARVEMETIGRRLSTTWPLTNRQVVPRIQNFTQYFVGSQETVIYESMWGAVGFVLLIACANLANLKLATALGRARNLSICMALGAGRWRIVRRLLIETVMLSAMGGVFGWLVGRWGVRIYVAMDVRYRPFGMDMYNMDYRVVGYLLAISLGTGILFGLAPALRLSKFDVNTVLKDGGSGAVGAERRYHLPSLLVIGEVALAVVLLAGAGVMIRSLLNFYLADIGVRTAEVFIAHLDLPQATYPDGTAQISLFSKFKTRLESIPGVESVSFANHFPTGGSAIFSYQLAGDSLADERDRPKVSALIISPSYFHTLGAVLLSGREFEAVDRISKTPLVIVNQQYASKYWPGQNPLGEHLRLFGDKAPEAWLTVVGVVSNIVQNDTTRQTTEPLIYLPYWQEPAPGMWVFARTQHGAGNVATALRREIQALDSSIAISNLSDLTQFLERSGGYRPRRTNAVLFLIFAMIALLLAAVGLYAVIAQSVSRRTQEIGIRMAIGATARDILKLVLTQGMLLLGIGLTIGLAASLAVNRILKAGLVQVSPSDPSTLLVASGVLILAAMLGCLIPARRAMRIDPANAIRHE